MIELGEYVVGGYLPTSFLDWPGHVTSVIFTAGCNFRCPWCHNSDIVLGQSEPVSLSVILADVGRRWKFLDGVVISGGEPTLWQGLLPLLHRLKEIGLAVKLDTNGSNPQLLREILIDKLVVCVAMDIKAPFNDEILSRVTGVRTSAALLMQSVLIIKELAPSYELRTTWSPRFLASAELRQIQRDLDYDSNWIVQTFVPVNCLDLEYREYAKVDAEEIKKILPNVKIRG